MHVATKKYYGRKSFMQGGHLFMPFSRNSWQLLGKRATAGLNFWCVMPDFIYYTYFVRNFK